MRWLARDLDEQINSVKRELDNLEELWVLKSRTELRKKIFTINTSFYLIDEFENIFLKTYNPLDEVKRYFKTQSLLEVVIVNKSIEKKLFEDGKAILDIFMIGEIEREEFSEFLQSIFFDRKVKFAIISTEDFFNRLSYWDKLIHNILREKWNIFIKDALKVKEKLD
jgi:nicotinamide riboside kinase